MEINRNEPCPCGSGHKYKKCCHINLHPAGYTENEITILKLNKWTACKGGVGREREAFCKEFIKNKHLVNKTIKAKQLEEAQSSGGTISCRPGCVYCCYHYITATLDEVEAVVYYLYQNVATLNHFLEAYRGWRAKLDENMALMTDIARSYNDHIQDRESSEKEERFQSLASQYNALDLPCPFLRDEMCLIYPVRPWVCSGFVAFTPNDWCRHDSPDKPRTMSITGFRDMRKVPHYRNPRVVWMNMPKAVYGILQGGAFALSKIPGLETLERETMEDPEVKHLLNKVRRV